MRNQKYWNFKNLVENQPDEEAEDVEINISGEIVNIPCWDGDVSSNSFKAELDKYPNAKTITVGLNTPGGDMFEAIAIGNYLKSHPAKTTAKIYAMCASAGTAIADSCDEVHIYDNAIFMIHDPMTVGSGGIQFFQKTVGRLETAKETLVTTYKNHSHLEEQVLRDLMTEETWMTAKQALENGFVTKIISSKAESEKVDEIQNFLHGQVFKNFSKFPTGVFKNLLQSKKTESVIKNKIEKGDEKIVDITKIKNEHPEIVNQLKNEAMADEKERIIKIMNLGTKQNLPEEIVKNAIDKGTSPADFAYEVMNNSALQTEIKAKKELEKIEEETDESKAGKVAGETGEEDKTPDDKEKESVVNSVLNKAKNLWNGGIK